MSINNIPPKNLWNSKNASKLSLLKLLVYRSRLLGADLQVTNFGGGNTSTKLYLKDPLTNNKEKISKLKKSGLIIKILDENVEKINLEKDVLLISKKGF